MLNIQKIRWKNLLSTGNVFTEIDLTTNNTTLVVGPSGSGKSTIVEAVCYGLYGKPYRKINIPQLVNSINEKNMIVEVEFSTGQHNYMVRRGIKPSVFEIYCDGKPVNQSSTVKAYQDYLEQSILKMSHKAFCQIIVLGKASFIPFMQLTSQERRKVIEDLLDLQVFSTMNVLLKDKLSENQEQLKNIRVELSLIDEKLTLHRKLQSTIKENAEQLIKDAKEQLNCNQEQLQALQSLQEKELEKLNELKNYIINEQKLIDRKHKLSGLLDKLQTKISNANKVIDFFGNHDTCPTCKQEISIDFKSSTISTKHQIIDDLNVAIAQLKSDEIDKVSNELLVLKSIKSDIGKLDKSINSRLGEISAIKKSIKQLQDTIKDRQANKKVVVSDTTDIDKLYNDRKQIEIERERLLKEKETLDIAAVLLKDGGIKSKIIKQYVPVINNIINKYLTAMQFDTQFKLDENFNEKILSRHRDKFSYSSFSEGEKARLDLALMMAWRAVAKIRNNSSCNLLILDEVYDGSLDYEAKDILTNILLNLEHTHVLVISHVTGSSLADKFDQTLTFSKVKNFSKLVNS